MTDQISNQPELIIALVAPAGAPRAALRDRLKEALTTLGYQTIPIRPSDLLKRCSAVWVDKIYETEADRIEHLQDMGNKFRESLSDGGALARASIVSIREERKEKTEDPDKPSLRTAYIVDQLKHPAEVDLLRDVYGSSFILIGAHAPVDDRIENLQAIIADKAGRAEEGWVYHSRATDIIRKDEIQEGEFGQNTRDTYPKADFFVDVGVPGGEQQIFRFIELLFGHPFRTPKPDEYAMYQASAASLRSSDNSRQVGAAIATKKGDVVAVGTNEVPYRGGGLYWTDCDSPDARDQALGEDRAAKVRESVLVELLERLGSIKWLTSDVITKPMQDRAKEILPVLKGTKFLNIGEFSRHVHAEMASLIDAARRGVSIEGLTMYVTVFPCHNCAKHIIAAGIKKVFFLEPYPKSRADFLHHEEIKLDPKEENYAPKVGFLAFSGVAPRQYHLFAIGRKKGYTQGQWNDEKSTLLPKCVVRNALHAYLAAERQELEKLPDDAFKWDKKSVCP